MTTDSNTAAVKTKDVMKQQSAFAAYRSLIYGSAPLSHVILGEFLQTCFSGLGGALGILLRSKLYRPLFGSVAGKLVIGRNVVLRHPHKIHLGSGVILDDNCLIDAKGLDNDGIRIGDGVFIGRGSLVYCKNGNIRIGDRANLSSSCTVFSSNDLEIGAGTMIGAYTYILSGGEYDAASSVPYAEQSGMETQGPVSVGANCWIGARVTILDGASSIGDNCVLGAGTVVTKPVPANSVAIGVPARIVKTIEGTDA